MNIVLSGDSTTGSASKAATFSLENKEVLVCYIFLGRRDEFEASLVRLSASLIYAFYSERCYALSPSPEHTAALYSKSWS